MECKYCSTSLKKKHRYCYYCGRLARCLSCNTRLPKNVAACATCGNTTPSLIGRTESHRNKFELSEGKKGRTISTDFTDTTAASLGTVLEQVIGSKLRKPPKMGKDIGSDPKEEDAVVLEIESSNDVMQEKSGNEPPLKVDPVTLRPSMVFVNRNDEWRLGITDLKADHQLDFGRRILLLFLLLGEEKSFDVSNTEMNTLLKRIGVYDGGVRRYMSSNNDYGVRNGLYELNQFGRESASKILDEVFDQSIVKEWKFGSKKATTKASSSKYKLVDISLRDNQKPELRDQYNALKSPTKLNTILVILQFLIDNTDLEGVTVNQIFTACRKIGIEGPADIRRTIATGETRGLIDKAVRGQFIVTSLGKQEIAISTDNES